MFRFIVLTALALCLVATTAQAAGLATGAHLSLRNADTDATAGLFASGFFEMPDIAFWTPDYAEFAFESSGEGATESLTRLGGHWAVLSYPKLDVTLGGGAVVRALGVQATNIGEFVGIGGTLKDADGNVKFGGWVYVNADLPNPRPTVTFRTAYITTFEWPF